MKRKRRNATRSGAVWRLGLILLLSAALWPLSLRAEAPIGRFVIGVWSPAGWSHADYDSYDRFFTESDATHLANLGVNLLVQTPRIGNRDIDDFVDADPDNREDEDAHEIMQALEDTILTLFKAHGGLVVEQSAAEDLPSENPALEGPTYTSEFPFGDRLIDFAGVSSTINAHRLEQQAIALSSKWGGTDYENGFFGYFIGHEQYPKDRSGAWLGGIYDSSTYTNLGLVIDEIREHDTERAIVAVGSVNDIEAWTPGEQEAFRKVFFRSDMESPANILMNEQYIFNCVTDSETEVQNFLNELTALTVDQGSLTRTRDMVNKARSEGRKAEWYHIINVNNEYRCGTVAEPNACWTEREGITHRPQRRRPNKAELSVQAYMALARGATGIVYYSHTTNGLASMSDACIDDDLGTEDFLSVMTNCRVDFANNCAPDGNRGSWYFGLMRFSPYDVQMRTPSPMYQTVQTVNQKLKVIGAALYPEEYEPLTWVDNYDNFSTDRISATTLVDAVWPNGWPSLTAAGKLEFGQFHNGEADYVLVVNRANIVSGASQTIDLRFDVAQMKSDDAGSGSYLVEDVSVSSGTPSTLVADASGNLTVTGQTLAAGDARLYRIVRDRPGRVSLSTTTPSVGALVTATLEDPDVPVTNELWTWQRRLPNRTVEDARAPLQSLEDLFQPKFTPSVLDVDRELRASVSYSDVLSSSDGFVFPLLDKSAQSVWTEPVSHGPTYLQVVTETESGGLQFVVSTCQLPLLEPGPECPAPTGGLLFTVDHVVLERCTGPSSDETCLEFPGADLVELVTGEIPSDAPGERSSQARGRVSSSLTFSEPVAAVDNRLDNRKTYRYRAYLVGPGEQESPKSDAVTVLGLRAEARSGAVELSWDTPAGIEGITGWGYRYKQEDGTWDGDSWETTGTGATVTAVEVGSLTNGESYEFQVRALRGTETGPESFVVSATPERPDTRGRVEWSTTQPRVGQELTPTLIDPDNPALAEARWRWRRQRWSRSDAGDSLSAPVPGSRSGESKLGVIARTRQYTPRVSDLHQWLWVEVTYTDDFDRHRVSATTSRAVGPGPPCAPANLKAAPGDGQVTLTWEAGCNNGGTIDRYQYRRLEARKWVRVPGDGSARRQQVTGLTNGEAHTFEVQARNGQGWGPAAQATATPAAAESPPPPPPPPLTVTYGASSYSAQEGGEAATVTVRLSPSASEALSIPITVNPPSGDFTVAGLTDGALSFAPEADEATFTITADQDDDTVDETVLLGFGDLPEEVSAGTPASATVTLFDDDVGTPVVSLSTTTPQVGQRMTATLTDLDGGLEAVAWQWQRRADGSSAWETLERTARYPITDLSRYTPVAADAGKQLRATVSYTDAHGASKSVQSAATDAVTWPPLTVTYGDSTYSASEGGAAATLTVRLSAEAEQLVKIPITRDPASGDYTVTWPGVEDTLSFSGSTTSQSFTVTATEDDDEDDETVLVGFGALPERVEAGTPASATVTLVDDTDHPGTVRLSTASPQVGRGMTATLVDGDGYLTAVTWQWQRRADGSSAWETLEQTARNPDLIADLSRYTPVAADAGKQLRATVSYTDAHGPDSAQSAATDAVTWPPLTVAYGDSTYSASEGGAAATLTVRLSAEAEQLVKIPITRDPASGDYTVTWPGVEDTLSFSGSTTSQSFTVTATEDDDEDDETVLVGFGALPERVEAGTPASATVTLVDDTDHPGTVRLSTSSPEVDQRMTATLTDLDGGLEAVAWQWQRRADAGSAWVPIERSPRYPIVDQSHYTPVAADRGKQLRATVGYTDAHGPNKSAQSAATSSVRPADTPGTVRLSTSSPEVDQRMTATLTDLDGGLEAVAWQWQRRADAGSAWVPIERSPRYPIVDQSHYTPVAADRGKQLRATVGYTDAHGPNKSAQSAATSSVRPADTPGTVRLSTSSPEVDQRMTATLTDLDGGLEAVAWQWQRRADAGSAWVPIERSPRYPIVDQSHYTPVAADRGKQLRATVGYTDAHGPNKSAQSAATSSVRPTDTPGTVRLSTSSPEVDQRMTATLTDLDGGLEAVAWQWQRRADAGSAWVPIERSPRYPIVDQSHYTPVAADRGKQLRATVGYTDAHGPNKSAQSAATSSVRPADTPGTVRLSTSSPEVDQRMTATLTDLDGGLEAVAWQWQRRADAGSAWVPIERSPRYPIVDQSHYTPVAADRGKQLRATVGYTDAHGPNKSAQSAATSSVRPTDTPGTVRLSTSSPEVDQRMTATLTDLDGGLEAVAWQWQRRADAGSAWVPIERSPRYPIVDQSHYTPVAADRGKQLRATVGYTDAHGPNKSAQSAATSSVRPTDTPGTVRLSTSSPEVDQRVTATLTDLDGGLEAVAWQWQRRADAGSAWVPIERSPRYPIVDQSRYTPGTADVGKQLRARVDYDDGHGPDKAAASGETAPVVTVPSVPRDFTAEAGNRQVALSWRAPVSDGGLSLTGYEYRRRAGSGSWSGWTGVGTNTTRTVTGLSNGTRYRFEVRARNAAGAGAAARASATPVQPNRGPYFTSGPTSVSFAENGSGPVGRYTARDPDGDAITWSRTGTEASAFQLEGTGTTRTLTFDTAPDYEAGRSYEVTVEVSDGSLQAERTVRVTVTDEPEPPDPPSGVRVSAPDNMGHERLSVSWTAPDNRGRPALSGNDVHYCKTNEVFFCDSYNIWSSLTVGGSATGTLLTGLSSHTGYTVRVRARNAEGTSGWSARATGRTRSAAAKALAGQLAVTGMKGLAALAAPNPFNPSTTLYFQLTETGEASLVVYSLAGQVVKTLIPNRTLKAGIHRVDWEGQDQQGRPVAAGVYLYRLAAGDQAIVRKMTLLR